MNSGMDSDVDSGMDSGQATKEAQNVIRPIKTIGKSQNNDKM